MTDELTRRAIAELRAQQPDNFEGVPDEALERLFSTQAIRLRLAVGDLGRAIRGTLPRPLRRLLGEREGVD